MNQRECKKFIKMIDLGQIDKLKQTFKEELQNLEIKSIKGGRSATDIRKFKKMLKSAGDKYYGFKIEEAFQIFTDTKIAFKLNPGQYISWLEKIENEEDYPDVVWVFDKHPITDKSDLKIDLDKLVQLDDDSTYDFEVSETEVIKIKPFYLRLACVVLGDNLRIHINGLNSPIRLSSVVGQCLIAPTR